MSEERLVAEIPGELKRLVDADQRTNRDVVEAALWREFGGERKAAVERRIENKRAELESAKNTLESEREHVDEIRQEIEDLQAAMENAADEQQRKREELAEVSDQLPPTRELNADHPVVRNWSEKLDMEADEFIAELRDYRSQQ